MTDRPDIELLEAGDRYALAVLAIERRDDAVAWRGLEAAKADLLATAYSRHLAVRGAVGVPEDTPAADSSNSSSSNLGSVGVQETPQP